MTVNTFDSRNLTDMLSVNGPTLRTILFGADPREAVPRRGWTAFRETLSHVRPEMRPAVERELSAAIAGLLDVDVSQALLAGWRAHTKLREAARNTAAAGSASEIVTLATHRIESSYLPHVDLMVDGVKVASVEVTIEVSMEIHGMIATVRGGWLTTVHTGRCVIHVALLFADAELLGGTAEFDVPGTVALGNGIDLLDRDERQRLHRR